MTREDQNQRLAQIRTQADEIPIRVWQRETWGRTTQKAI
jgi:hypothetical protein